MQAAPAQVFVGRERELAALNAALSSARSGEPRVVMLEGEAGIGKSSLVFEFQATHRQMLALVAGAEEAESAIPFGIVQQLLAAAVAASPDILSGLPLLSAGPGPDADPMRVGAELLAMTSELQRRDPLALVIEDLQWSDLPSARALLFAFRRLRADQMVAIVTSRPAGTSPLGPGWARFTATDRHALQLRLGGLDAGEIGTLCRELGRTRLTQQTVRRLAEQTGGSPLLARALLAELTDEALNRADGPLLVPRPLSELMAGRLGGLSTQARELVAAAAVLGDHCALAELSQVAGIASPAMVLDEAEQAGLLVERNTPTGWRVSFGHVLVREAIYNGLGPARRRLLHQRASVVLGDAESLDHRTAAALGADPVLAADLDAAAAAAASAGQLLQAAKFLEQAALVTLRGQARDERILSAFEFQILAADAAGAERSRHAVEQLPASARRDNWLGQLALLTARPGDAARLLRSAWEAHDPATEADVGAEAAIGLGTVLFLSGSFADGSAWLGRAIALATGNETWCDAARCNYSIPLLFDGRKSAALDLFGDMPSVAALVPLAHTDALSYRGFAKLWSDDLPGAIEDLTVAVARITGGLVVRYPAQALGMLAETEFRAGRWDDSRGHAELAVSLAADADRDYDLPFVHSLAVPVAACRGDWTTAARHADDAEQAEPSVGGLASVFVAHGRAILGFARNDPAEVLRGVALPLRLREADSYEDPVCFWWRPLHVWALIRTGELSSAEAILTEYEERAGERGAQAARILTPWLRGTLTQARSQPVAAEQVLRAGRQATGCLPFPFCQALLAREHGRCLAKLKRRREAIRALTEAHRIFARLAAEPFVRGCASELVALGLRSSSGDEPDLAGLTAQEMRIARLVASGLSNRAVAAELYLSPKTIEYHLAHVFTKLGVRNRHELIVRVGAPGRAITQESIGP
jgi:DNA-binding CsgD family transcriptional regulator/tetratricopeptide (TPR) repeat protein